MIRGFLRPNERELRLWSGPADLDLRQNKHVAQEWGDEDEGEDEHES